MRILIRRLGLSGYSQYERIHSINFRWGISFPAKCWAMYPVQDIAAYFEEAFRFLALGILGAGESRHGNPKFPTARRADPDRRSGTQPFDDSEHPGWHEKQCPTLRPMPKNPMNAYLGRGHQPGKNHESA